MEALKFKKKIFPTSDLIRLKYYVNTLWKKLFIWFWKLHKNAKTVIMYIEKIFLK